LYSYFHKYYNIDHDVVNNEIKNAMKTFKRRQGQPYREAELWQEVGLTLEKYNDAVLEFQEKSSDFGIIASYVCPASPFTLKPGRFFDIGIVSIPLAIQYGMNLFMAHRLSSQFS
jgi:hypothetical protein